MNFEDAEAVVWGIEIMYEANVERLGEEEAEKVKHQALMSLGDAFRAVNREDNDLCPFPIADQVRTRRCKNCFPKPQFLFRYISGSGFSKMCMMCEDESRVAA